MFPAIAPNITGMPHPASAKPRSMPRLCHAKPEKCQAGEVPSPNSVLAKVTEYGIEEGEMVS